MFYAIFIEIISKVDRKETMASLMPTDNELFSSSSASKEDKKKKKKKKRKKYDDDNNNNVKNNNNMSVKKFE